MQKTFFQLENRYIIDIVFTYSFPLYHTTNHITNNEMIYLRFYSLKQSIPDLGSKEIVQILTSSELPKNKMKELVLKLVSSPCKLSTHVIPFSSVYFVGF